MTMSFDGQRAYDHVKYLTVDVGSRLFGSESDRQATDYMRSYFESLGLKVIEQPFKVRTGAILEHKLEILDPLLGEIPSQPILLSPATPDDGLTGELVFVEGDCAPQVGPHLAGKIVLWSNQERSHSQHQILLKHNPLAIVGISPPVGVSPKHFTMAWDVRPHRPVTAFQITYEDGIRLVRSGARRARLFLRTEVYEGTTRNVVAEVTGSDLPEEIIVVGGHHDTKHDLPGATDNAGGTAVVMELARLYAHHGSRRTLRFAAWAGEEAGLLGSRHYVRELKRRDREERAVEGFDERHDKTELERHLLCINLDVHGSILGHFFASAVGPPDLFATLRVLSKELGVPLPVGEAGGGSDHAPFAHAGIPAITVSRGGGYAGYIHTPQDAIDLIAPRPLEEIGRLIDTFISRTAASAHVWPFERQVPEESRQAIEKTLQRLLPHTEERGYL